MTSFSLINQAASAIAWPSHIRIFKVDSDCMAPTFDQGDYLAVDTEQRDVREGVYLFQTDDWIGVRRIHTPFAGGVTLSCDNELYDPQLDILVEDLSKLITGRVIFSEKRVY